MWIINDECSDVHICYLVITPHCLVIKPLCWDELVIWWILVGSKSRRSCFKHDASNTTDMRQAHKTLPGTSECKMRCCNVQPGGVCWFWVSMLTVKEGHRGWNPWKIQSPYGWTNGIKAIKAKMIALVLPHLKNISLFNEQRVGSPLFISNHDVLS